MNGLRMLENELVPVYETDAGEKVVYGRELHSVLNVKSRYNDWVRNRFNECDAAENEDYQTLTKNLVNGGKEKDHIIKLDTAKEMAMLERNEKGKQVRRYFIEVEKKYKEMVSEKAQDFEPRTLNTDQVIKIGEIMAGCFKWNVPYVRNILRHIIPDIDEIWEQAADEGMKADESVKTEVKPQPQPKNHSDIRAGYAKPFNDKKFSDYLWERRISGRWLSEQIGCSEGCVSKWRTGKVAPGKHYRVLICEVLEVPEGYFDKRVRRKKG